MVEEADATRAERAIREVNAGTYVVDTAFLFKALARVRAQNAQGEYYLTDIVGLAVAEGRRVAGLKSPIPRNVSGSIPVSISPGSNRSCRNAFGRDG